MATFSYQSGFLSERDHYRVWVESFACLLVRLKCAGPFRHPMLRIAMKLFVPAVSLLIFLSGCASVPKEAGDDADRLALAIQTLSPMVDPVDARRVAGILVDESLKLAERYETVGEPWLQNILVNSGVRERGLCYHWVNDLMTVLEREPFRSLVFYRVGSKLGTLQEHNALVITPYGSRLDEGLLVDAWRYQGRLYWIRVLADDLEWEEMVLDHNF